MTPDQINQLRQLLKKAKKLWSSIDVPNRCEYTYVNICPAKRIIEEALTLLPCPTCNGEKKIWSEGYGDGCEIDCPDCK